jgi:putative flavoprotein involved in K+ transport
MNTVSIDTVVIGAGHAGLCMSYILQESSRDHLVLEKHAALHQWKTKRWDSFKLNTPLGYSRIMGQNDGQLDEQMSIPLFESIEMWEQTIRERKFPIVESCKVTDVSKNDDGTFTVLANEGTEDETSYIARNVIAAPGNYQQAKIPSYASDLPAHIKQLDVGSYKNPSQIEGAVLVVGSGQTGIQLGEELALAGKKVFMATSPIGGSLRSYRGEDVFFWMDRVGLLTMPKEALPDPNMRYNKNPFTGNDHPISYHSLARQGVSFFGKLEGIAEEGNMANFKNNLQENIAIAQGGYDFLISAIEGWIEATGNTGKFPEPKQEKEWVPDPELMQRKAPATLNLKNNNITTILWATGWKADFSWLNIPSIASKIGPHGSPESCETAEPGFFWLGFHWLRFLNSGNVAGFHHDARAIGTQLR